MHLTTVVPAKKTTVLAVDDNPTALRLMESMLARNKYHVLTAVNGKDALRLMAKRGEEVDIILLDRIMPEMDGMEFCRRMKADPKYRLIPIIMQTAAGKPQEIKEGIEAGVFYYLVKPLVSETLTSIVEAARVKIHKYRERRKQYVERQESMTMVQSMKCVFKTLEEGEKLAVFISQFYPDPDRVFTGVSELFINAVEHGNLGITYEEKGKLLQQNTLVEEIKQRLSDPPVKAKEVRVTFAKKEDNFVLEIEDEGQGFVWQDFLQIVPERATHSHGRGIAMAKMLSFDQLYYNDKGTKVTTMVHNISGGNGPDTLQEQEQ